MALVEDEIRARVLEFMVRLTLAKGEPERLAAVKQGLRAAADQGLTPLRVRTDLRAALTDPGLAGLLPDPADNLSWTIFEEVARQYFDRASAGIDVWTPDDQEEWRKVTREVFDVTSSVI